MKNAEGSFFSSSLPQICCLSEKVTVCNIIMMVAKDFGGKKVTVCNISMMVAKDFGGKIVTWCNISMAVSYTHLTLPTTAEV